MRTANSKLKVAVLAGGIGSEREVSIASGRCVADALEQAGFSVLTADVRPDSLDILDEAGIDVFFPVLHGEFGEDGRLQRILEAKSLLYTSSGSAASELAFDKMASKKLFDDVGVATPRAVEFTSETDPEQIEEQLRDLAGIWQQGMSSSLSGREAASGSASYRHHMKLSSPRRKLSMSSAIV
ncbi:MAG: D-alanine--D-alanine ligase [Planctomycetota bacterium]